MPRMCKNCGGSLTIKQVVMNSSLCSQCARVSPSRVAVHPPRFANYKNYIKLNFDAMVAAELKK
jgi:hypothetical protein